jgi:hypothetical protein
VAGDRRAWDRRGRTRMPPDDSSSDRRSMVDRPAIVRHGALWAVYVRT